MFITNTGTGGTTTVTPTTYNEAIARHKDVTTNSASITIPQGADRVEIYNVDLINDVTVNSQRLEAGLSTSFTSRVNEIDKTVERSPAYVINNPSSATIQIIVYYPSTSTVDLNLIA